MTGAVDVWVNLFTEEAMERMARSIIQKTGEVIGDEGLFRTAGEPPESFVERMESLGVDAALVPSMKFASAHTDKDEVWISEETVAELCSSYPDYFEGLVGINPYAGMEGVRRLEETVLEDGFVGAHIVPYGFRLPPNDRRYYPFYAKCAELGVPVMIQVGHTTVRMSNGPGRPNHLEDVAIEFPELDIVAANIGWPWTSESVALAWTHPNIYIATTGHGPQYWEQEFIDFVRGRGHDKVMWGTNYPTIDLGDGLRGVSDLNLSDDIERKLLSENARSVFEL